MTIPFFKAEPDAEYCVVCGKKTGYKKETPIDLRYGYIAGAGQLCRTCYMEIYVMKKEKR